MLIPLNLDGNVPIYRQIETFLRGNILNGNLQPDTRLPASRKLARDLGVSRITIDTAYAELQADGLVMSRTGSGTYVLHSPARVHTLPNETLDIWPQWQLELKAGDLGVDAPDRLLAASGHRSPISFAGGGGDSRLFPSEDFRKILQMTGRRHGSAALEYGDYRGHLPLRAAIARVLASQGLQTHPANILVTSGSQQILALCTKLLLRPGETVLVESPTYARALDLFRDHGLRIIDIPVDKHGMQVEKLEDMLQQFHPKLIYTIPNFQNPTGATLSRSRRQLLLSLASRYNVPVLEDDFVGDLRYEGSGQPSLKSLDSGGRVIYAGTFSKMLLPGLRVGFAVAEGPVYESIANHKYIHDIATSNLIQHALEEYMTIGRYQAHLRRSCHVYRKRRDAMLKAIESLLPVDTEVSVPQGGLFLWVGLPPGLSADRLLPLACAEGVSFAPGRSFFADKLQGERYLRLNFASANPEEIQEGIRRLALVISKASAQVI